jgi:hypothetical protein
MGLFAKKASQSFIVVNGRKFDPKTGDEIFDRTNDTQRTLQAKDQAACQSRKCIKLINKKSNAVGPPTGPSP